MTMHAPTSNEELIELIRGETRIRCRQGGSKSALSADANVDLSGWSGILEYDASEYTLTARAATPIREISQLLGEHGQFLPFDPPFSEDGATLAGSLAAGVSGAGRYRFGGIRDFVLGVKMVTGTGRVVFGGGKVVKNAAGFDIPKLMVGSLGMFGVMTELTFKVFPLAEIYTTLQIPHPSMAEAAGTLLELGKSQTELACLELDDQATLSLRVGGQRDAAERRVDRIRDLTGRDSTRMNDEDDRAYWADAGQFRWVSDQDALIRVPITPALVSDLESESMIGDLPRRYSVGGSLLWICCPSASCAELTDLLHRHQLSGVVIRKGDVAESEAGLAGPLLAYEESPFQHMLQSVFDPEGKFKVGALTNSTT